MESYRKKPELLEYELKLKQLEQNLKGLINKQEQEDGQDKKRSLSREHTTPKQGDEVQRRLLKLEDRLIKQDQRIDQHEIRVKKAVERICNEIDSQPWQSFLENIRISLEAKILLIEDKVMLFQNEIEEKIEQMLKAVNDRVAIIENNTNKINKQMQQFFSNRDKENGDTVNNLFEMIKKCINSQQQIVDEFMTLKSNLRLSSFDLKDRKPLKMESDSKSVNRIQSQQSGHLFSQGKSKKDSFRQSTLIQEKGLDRELQEISQPNQKHKSYNELKEQDFEKMRKNSIIEQQWIKESQQYKNAIDQEINQRLQKEDQDRRAQIERDKTLIRKSVERQNRQSSKNRI